MKNTIEYLLKVLTVCQAVWVLTLMGFLMWHYVYRSIKSRFIEKNAIAMGISYSLITVATMISSLRGVYQWNSFWQMIIIIGYAFGDYAIVRLLFHVTKNERTKRALEKYIKEHQNNNDDTR